MKNVLSIFFLGIMIFIAAPIALPDCFPDDPPDPIEFVGDVLFGGLFSDIELFGDKIYATNGYGLLIFSKTDPETGQEMPLTEVDRLPTPGNANAVSISEYMYAYIADGVDGLRVIDLGSDILPPREVGSLEALGEVFGVTHKRGVVFLAEGDAGLSIVDASTAEAPVRIGHLDTSGSSLDVAVSGSVAYVADEIGGLLLVDISSLSEPKLLSSYIPVGLARGVVVKDSLAYVAAGAGGLYIVDVTDPLNPEFVGALNTPGSAFKVSLSGTMAFVADTFGGVHVVDISNPALPTLVSSLTTFEEDALIANAVAGTETDLYVGDAVGQLLRVDISTPDAPEIVESYQKEGRINFVKINGTYGYVADRNQGMHIVNFTNPLDPLLVKTLALDGEPQRIAISPNGDYAYVTNLSGIKTVFIDDPNEAREVGFNFTAGEAVGVAVSATRLYVAESNSGNQNAGLRIFDIELPFQPQEVGYFPMGLADCQDVAVNGVFAFVVSADILASFHVIDVTDPANPQRIGLGSVGTARGIAIRGTNAFVATDTGLTIVDITNPVLPNVIAEVTLSSAGQSVALHGNIAYVAIGDGGFQTVNVAVPSAPVAEQSFNAASFTHNADAQLITGNFLILGDLYDLAIFRIPGSVEE